MFRKALKLNPTYTEAYFNLGEDARCIGLLVHSVNLTLFLILGTLFIQMGDLSKGEQYLKKALKLNPGHSGAANNLKVIEHYKKQRQQQS